MVEHWQIGNDMADEASPNPLYETTIGDSPSTYRIYPRGWICPKCGAVWAPGVRECEHCKPFVFVEVNIAG